MQETLTTIEEESQNNFSTLTANQLKTALQNKENSKAALQNKENSKAALEKKLEAEENAKKWNQICAKAFLGLFFAAIILAVVVYLAPIIVPALAIASISPLGVALVGLVHGVAGAYCNYKYTKNKEKIEDYNGQINGYDSEITKCEQQIKGCEEEIKKCEQQIKGCEEEIKKKNLEGTILKLGKAIKGRHRSESVIVQSNPSLESDQKIKGRRVKSNTNNKNRLY